VSHSRQPLALALLFALIALVLAANVARVGSDYDDALITYRYAERLADGHGFTYNDGERVLGTSTPLWTLILAGAHALGIDIPRAADGLNVLLFALTVFFLMRFLDVVSGRWTAAMGGLLFLLSPLHARAASYGMEAIAFCCLIAATCWFTAIRSPVAAGIATGLAMCLRLEGVLLAGAVFLAGRFRGRGLATWAIIAGGLALAWAAAATVYFGSPLPQSLSAKLLHTHRPDVMDTLRFLFFESPVRLAFTVLALAGLALLTVKRRHADVQPMAWFFAAYTAFYLVGRPTPYEWYLPPLHIAVIALGAIAAGARLDSIATRLGSRAAWGAVALGGALVVGMHARVVEQTRAWSATVEATYVPLGAWLTEHSTSTDSLYCGDIGYVGYLTKRPVLDAAALVSRRVLDARRDGRSANELLPELRPAYFVVPVQPNVFPVRWPDAETERGYVPVKRVPDGPLVLTDEETSAHFASRPVWTPEYMVYARRDVAEREGLPLTLP
jgi:hypothetical protein